MKRFVPASHSSRFKASCVSFNNGLQAILGETVSLDEVEFDDCLGQSVALAVMYHS